MSDTPQHPPKRRMTFVDPERLAGGLIDAVAIAGVGSIVFGAWLIYRPAAFIVAGLMLVGYALTMARKGL